MIIVCVRVDDFSSYIRFGACNAVQWLCAWIFMAETVYGSLMYMKFSAAKDAH